MFSQPAMGGRHWRRPLQNITVQAESVPSVRIDLAVYADTPWPSPAVMQSVLVAVAASNGGHHPKVTRSMFSHPAMGGRHWRRSLQNITVQAELLPQRALGLR